MFRPLPIYFILCVLMTYNSLAKGTDTFRIHTDFPTLNKESKIVQNIYYASDTDFTGALLMQVYRFKNDSDSTLVLKKQGQKILFKQGSNKITLDFGKGDTNTVCHPKFYEVLKRANAIAPGIYKIFLSVKRTNTGNIYNCRYFQEADSTLSPHSPLRQDVNENLAPPSKSFLGLRLKKSLHKVESLPAGNTLMNAKTKISKSARARGLISVQHSDKKKSYVDYFYQDWFVGRYEVQNGQKLGDHLKQEDNLEQTPKYNNSRSAGLDAPPSLFSQSKTIQKDKKDQKEIKGEISLSSNLSNGQEQYSAVDNNYHEIKGQIELPICNLPVQIEGLYTTQDENRQIKSSYFRVHYDVNELKNKLNQSVNAYNNKFNETKSKGVGMKSIYQSSINAMESQKAKLQNEVNAESDPKKLNAGDYKTGKLGTELGNDIKSQSKDTSGLKQSFEPRPDSSSNPGKPDSTNGAPNVSGTAGQFKNEQNEETKKLEDKKRQVEAKKKQIDALNKKIEKYKILLAQNENTNHFDSLVGYNKTKDFSGQSDMTYRQMVKRSANLLPDGEAKKFTTGLTSFDAGMFPKNESKYTMSGQMIKGADMGYDLGICETGVTIGKTQFIGRDGSLDKYTCYSGRVSAKPVKSQKISLLYYGYTVDHNMVAGDAFFKNANIAAPSFFEPVHIISGKYDGSFSRFVTLGAETATSIKNSDKSDNPHYSQADKMAYHFSVDGHIPKTGISLQSSYDNTEKGFVNNTLPASLSGTEQYKVAGKSTIFRSLIALGIEYNYFVQNNYASKSSNTKWGFDAKINFKKFPSFSISYKPFTTFQSYNDTLNIPQRLLLGSVTTAKSTYRIKMHEKSINFSLMYNKSITTMDTAKYGSEMMQLAAIYTDKTWNATVSTGFMNMTGANSVPTPTPITAPTQPNNTKFLSMSASYKFSKLLSVDGGQDFGLASFGFCKYSFNTGVMYRPEKSPVSVRVNFRFTTYELNQGDLWKQLYSGRIEILYRIKSQASKSNRNF